MHEDAAERSLANDGDGWRTFAFIEAGDFLDLLGGLGEILEGNLEGSEAVFDIRKPGRKDLDPVGGRLDGEHDSEDDRGEKG